MQDNEFYHVLSIAGFDGSGGAGIQGDLKTFSALGCYGTTALTAIPIQNTVGVKTIYDIPTWCLEEQIKAILDDIPIHAVKIGMLHRPDIVHSVANILAQYQVKNIVLDPVMLAKNGSRLLDLDALVIMKKNLFPLITVLTPNLPEASEILGKEIKTKEQMEQAAFELITMGPEAVVVKGGHFDGPCDDCLVLKNSPEVHWLSTVRIQTKNTHGTGCTFSSAIASFLAKGDPIIDSVKKAKEYLTQSIKAGAPITTGKGNGSVHHFHHLWNFLKGY